MLTMRRPLVLDTRERKFQTRRALSDKTIVPSMAVYPRSDSDCRVSSANLLRLVTDIFARCLGKFIENILVRLGSAQTSNRSYRMPASTVMHCFVIIRLSSDARNSAVLEMSSGKSEVFRH